MNKEVMLKWKEETGIDLREVYGQTEVVSYVYGGGGGGGWGVGGHS